MKILVTGSSGTVGTRLCEKLMEQGHDVVGVDWEPCKWQKSVEAIRIDADLRDPAALASLPDSVDSIVHLAANARVFDLVEDPQKAMDNVLTTFNTLEYARKIGAKQFLFASSRETYGNTNVEVLSEDQVRIENCESPYTASKLSGEALVHSYEECYGLPFIIFRFSNVYGMYDDSDRVVPLFYRRAKANDPLTVFGAEKCLDFTYIDDCVQGIMAGIEQFDSAKGDTYNLAIGSGTKILDLAEMMKELLDSTSDIEVGSPRTGEVIKYVADISKAKAALGYDPQIPFEEGIRKAVEWYQSQ